MHDDASFVNQQAGRGAAAKTKLKAPGSTWRTLSLTTEVLDPVWEVLDPVHSVNLVTAVMSFTSLTCEVGRNFIINTFYITGVSLGPFGVRSR